MFGQLHMKEKMKYLIRLKNSSKFPATKLSKHCQIVFCGLTGLVSDQPMLIFSVHLLSLHWIQETGNEQIAIFTNILSSNKKLK